MPLIVVPPTPHSEYATEFTKIYFETEDIIVGETAFECSMIYYKNPKYPPLFVAVRSVELIRNTPKYILDSLEDVLLARKIIQDVKKELDKYLDDDVFFEDFALRINDVARSTRFIMSLE